MGKLIAFAGPEAGVGRSVCAASLAMILAQRHRCLALDLDAHSRNLQSYFGLQAVNVGIGEVLQVADAPLESVQSRTRIANLDCVGWSAGGGGSVGLGSLKIDALFRALQAHPADYVFATLPAGMTDDALDIFTSADIPIIVTPGASESLERVFEFLRHCASSGFSRNVYLIVNRVQRGGELRDASALAEKATSTLSLSVGILGTIQHDQQIEMGFRPGMSLSIQRLQTSTSFAFEDIATRIERLLPCSRPSPPPTRQPKEHRANSGKGRRFPISLDVFGKKLERLQQEHRELQNAHAKMTAERNALQQERDSLLQEREVLTQRLAVQYDYMSVIEGTGKLVGPDILRRERSKLIGELRSHPPHSITLIALDDSGLDGSEFGIEMRSVLEAGGWTVKLVFAALEKDQFYGLEVAADGSPGAVEGSRILRRALGKINIRTRELTAPSPKQFDPLRLIIGKSNW